MKVASLDRWFSAFLVLVGLHVVVSSVQLGLYRNSVPGPGFFPMVAGLLILSLSAMLFLRSFVKRAALEEWISPKVIGIILLMTAAIVIFVFVAPLLGLGIAAFLLMIVIGLLTQEPHRRGRAFYLRLVLVSLGTAVLCHVLFGTVIRTPLILGPLGF